jgi:hypothetical protein
MKQFLAMTAVVLSAYSQSLTQADRDRAFAYTFIRTS